MTRRSRVWLGVAVIFTVGNFVGGVFAAAQGEFSHAGVHVALTLLGAYLARRFWRPGESVSTAQPGEFTDLLTHLEQSVDSVAIEVERIGEGQRFMTHFFSENGIPQEVGENAPSSAVREPSRQTGP
ncbi:MAG: hypothetical protein ABIW79_04930 [Gemmatimonas sp.]